MHIVAQDLVLKGVQRRQQETRACFKKTSSEVISFSNDRLHDCDDHTRHPRDESGQRPARHRITSMASAAAWLPHSTLRATDTSTWQGCPRRNPIPLREEQQRWCCTSTLIGGTRVIVKYELYSSACLKRRSPCCIHRPPLFVKARESNLSDATMNTTILDRRRMNNAYL